MPVQILPAVILDEIPTEPTDRTVLVGLDLSQHSAQTVAWVADHFMRPTDRLIVLHVSEPVVAQSDPALAPHTKEMAKVNRIATTEALLNLVAPLRSKPYGIKLVIADHSDPRAALLASVSAFKPDVMVLGCRGSGAASGGGTESPTAKLLHSIFIGSTSQYLLKHAHVPVVLVRDGMGVPDTSATMEGDVDVEMFAHILGN